MSGAGLLPVTENRILRWNSWPDYDKIALSNSGLSIVERGLTMSASRIASTMWKSANEKRMPIRSHDGQYVQSTEMPAISEKSPEKNLITGDKRL